VQNWCRAYAARRAADEQAFSVGAAPPTPPRTRKVAERRETPFSGSNRFFRGRAIAALRSLPAGESLALPELGRALKPDFADADTPWLETLVAGLARDGLLVLEEARVRLP
jgi:A/G-specific adenine glycosylase